MPFEDEGGPVLQPPPSIVAVKTVTDQPTQGGVTAGGDPLVQSVAKPISEAFAEANKAVKIIPTATPPAVGNLPDNASPGEWYMFASNPSTIYVMCPDNVWRALVLVAVS